MMKKQQSIYELNRIQQYIMQMSRFLENAHSFLMEQKIIVVRQNPKPESW